MVVAIVALIVALGGSAYAAVKLNGKNIKNGTITGNKLKNKTITTKKLSGSTVAALKGQKGDAGTPGTPGTALAYARVQFNGTVDTARSKGIAQANVTHTSPGIYCFSGLSFAPKNVVATIETPVNNNDLIFASIPDTSLCPAGQITVHTLQSGGVVQNNTFYVMFN
jgi:hypothetical protein